MPEKCFECRLSDRLKDEMSFSNIPEISPSSAKKFALYLSGVHYTSWSVNMEFRIYEERLSSRLANKRRCSQASFKFNINVWMCTSAGMCEASSDDQKLIDFFAGLCMWLSNGTCHFVKKTLVEVWQHCWYACGSAPCLWCKEHHIKYLLSILYMGIGIVL